MYVTGYLCELCGKCNGQTVHETCIICQCESCIICSPLIFFRAEKGVHFDEYVFGCSGCYWGNEFLSSADSLAWVSDEEDKDYSTDEWEFLLGHGDEM